MGLLDFMTPEEYEEKKEFKWFELPDPIAYDIDSVQSGDYIRCVELDRIFLFDGKQFIVVPRTFIGGTVYFPKDKGMKLLKGKTLAVSYTFINE